jgi:transcriptional regulator with XRE-family HTH domain
MKPDIKDVFASATAIEDAGPCDAHPVDIEVGGRIRTLRLLLGLKQHSLAEMIGVTHPELQKYEAGASRPEARRLLGISGALNVPASFFFGSLPALAAE